MAEKTWREKRAEQERANAIADAKATAAVDKQRGPVGKALVGAANPLANAIMRNFQPKEYSTEYEQTYAQEMKPIKKACGGAVKKMAKGGSVCRGGGAATRGTKFSGVK